jgi:hypothetical protein
MHTRAILSPAADRQIVDQAGGVVKLLIEIGDGLFGG